MRHHIRLIFLYNSCQNFTKKWRSEHENRNLYTNYEHKFEKMYMKFVLYTKMLILSCDSVHTCRTTRKDLKVYTKASFPCTKFSFSFTFSQINVQNSCTNYQFFVYEFLVWILQFFYFLFNFPMNVQKKLSRIILVLFVLKCNQMLKKISSKIGLSEPNDSYIKISW